MASTFSGTDVVTCGTTGLNTLVEQTVVALAYPTAFARDHIIASKTDSVGFSAYRDFIIKDTGSMLLEAGRATVDCKAESNTGLITANNWWWIAYQLKTNGVNGDQKIFYSNLSSPLAEVGGYISQQVGSGAVSSDNSFSFCLGNSVTPQSFWGMTGAVAFVATWNRLLTLSELIAQQRRAWPTPGCQFFSHVGYPGTTVTDRSGNANHGTVTGTSAANHAPVLTPFGRTVTGWRGNASSGAAPVPMRRRGMFFGV